MIILTIINSILLLCIIYLIVYTRYISKRENENIRYKLEAFNSKLDSFKRVLVSFSSKHYD